MFCKNEQTCERTFGTLNLLSFVEFHEVVLEKKLIFFYLTPLHLLFTVLTNRIKIHETRYVCKQQMPPVATKAKLISPTFCPHPRDMMLVKCRQP